MPSIRRLLVALAVAVLAVASLVAAGQAAAAQLSGPSYVKYYVVAAAYQGGPENLPEIAGRFLGSTSRSDEIFELNAGVVQADGGRLTDPATLHAGWVLVLPWDAVGAGVQYGLPPTPAPTKPKPTYPAPRPTEQGAGSGTPAKPAAPKPANANACPSAPTGQGGSQTGWAMLRVAPNHAWAHSRGGGVMVAVVDSGVDAAVPELAGHVTVGADIVAGTGRGDTDCLGTGTAMAGIVAASADSGAGMHGMAPDAMVMPVRVAPTKAPVSESDQASAIEVAVSAGAKVIALGAYIDPSKPAVASAIEFAAGHDVVIVAGAPVRSGTGPAASAAPGSMRVGGVLRAGAIGIDGAAAAMYHPGSVDVVAPGVDVAGLGISGVGPVQASGTQYAVAFVAGQAALVRSMYPNLSAAQVVRRIEATADRMGSGPPDATYGWGLINPGEAIARVIADENRRPDPAADAGSGGVWSSLRTWALIIIILLTLAMVLLLILRIRRMLRVAPLAALPAAEDQPTRETARELVEEMVGARREVDERATTNIDLHVRREAGSTAPADTLSVEPTTATRPAEAAARSGSHADRSRGSLGEREDRPRRTQPDAEWWRQGPNGA